MSGGSPQTAAEQLRTALLDNGVRRVSIELQQGVAGSGWGVAPFRRGLGHHIASRPSQGLTPGLALVKRGRSDLAGPLCNGYGGYDLTARIITLGWANHPGAGGPWPVPGWGTVPVNNGRPYIFGWEFEGGFEPYTDEMHDFMARCGAGTLQWLGNAPLECWDEHKGWAGPRKPDRIGYTTASGRARIGAVRGTTPPPTVQEDDDMKLIQHTDRGIAVVGPGYFKSLNLEELPQAVRVWGNPVVFTLAREFDLARAVAMNGLTVGSTGQQLSEAVAKLSGLPTADVDEEALAAALAPNLAGVDAAAIADALRQVLREGVGTPAGS